LGIQRGTQKRCGQSKEQPKTWHETSGGRVAASASYHKLGERIDTKVQRAGLFMSYLYSAQKLGLLCPSNEQLRLISSMIS
jgi:hypothetical protein